VNANGWRARCARTQELLDANQVLLRTQRELSGYKKGVMG
jgi:hypothetical protein